MGIEALLDIVASACPDRKALGRRESAISFGELQQRARGGAASLREAGAGHVAYLGLNSPAFATAVFATAIAGVPITPLNYRLPDHELNDLLGQLERPVVIADAEMVDRLAGSRTPVIEASDWFSQSATAPSAGASTAADDAVAVLLFTSGTTSRPKAVLLRHENLLAYILQTVELLSADENECALVSMPPYHIAGVAAVLSSVYAARRVAYLPAFTPDEWLELVRAEGVTHATVVPTMLTRIVDHLGDSVADTPTLTTLSYGGARIAPGVLKSALAQLPATGFVNAYGLTETSSTITLLGPEHHRAAVESDDPAVRARLLSAGRAVPSVELEIRGDGGEVLPPGEVGELWVRGGQVSGEYAGSGSALDADGWFRTRDRASLDADGFLFLEGRSDDIIIRGGENVAPAEIEEVLLRHPAVREAAVVGLPDEEWGERIAAVVVPTPGEVVAMDELDAFARERLRSSRTPDQIVVWSSLPHNPTGKLVRRAVVEQLTADEPG